MYGVVRNDAENLCLMISFVNCKIAVGAPVMDHLCRALSFHRQLNCIRGASSKRFEMRLVSNRFIAASPEHRPLISFFCLDACFVLMSFGYLFVCF
jgi:hypothetical protein